MSKISILLPTYGEGINLLKIIVALEKSLFGEDYEILIINDENPDGSVEIIKKMETEYKKVRGIFSNKRRGKTKAIKDGFKEAKGDIIVILDADLQYSPDDLPKLIEALKSSDVVNGLRVQRKDNVFRKIESKIYNMLVEFFFNVKFHDNNSGLKVFKRKVLEDIIDHLRYGWHRYLLILAAKKGYKVNEVSITHNNRTFGKSKFSSSPLKLFRGFWDLLSVKIFIMRSRF